MEAQVTRTIMIANTAKRVRMSTTNHKALLLMIMLDIR